MPFGNLWWKFRRAMHESFNVHTVKPFEPVQTREAILMVSSILNDTNRWEHSFKRLEASASLCTTYEWSLCSGPSGLSAEEKDREVENNELDGARNNTEWKERMDITRAILSPTIS